MNYTTLDGDVRRVDAVVTDLDGTLLGPDSELTNETRQALTLAVDRGLHVIAATGRSRRSALPKLEGTPIRWLICSNGGLVWDRKIDDVVLHRPLSGTTAAQVVDAVQAARPEAGFGWETLDGFRFDAAFVAHCPKVDEIGLGQDPGPLTSELEVTKMFICLPPLERAALQDAVLEVLPRSAVAAASGADFVETTAAGVDKGTTAHQFLATLGLSAENCVACGDNLNDVSLLEWAGWAVAMGNAQPAVAAMTDEIIQPNTEDGMAQLLRRVVSTTN